MLTELRLGAFKAFAYLQYAPLAPLTLIYGPNSSGKSSLIQSLLLIKQSLYVNRSSPNTLDFNGHLVDLGDFGNAAFRHNQKHMQFGLSYDTTFARRASEFVLPPAKARRSIDFRFGQLVEGSWTASDIPRKRRYVGLEECVYRIGEKEHSDHDGSFVFSLVEADADARKLGLKFRRGREHHFFRAKDRSEIPQIVDYLVRHFHGDLQKVESTLSGRRKDHSASPDLRRRTLEMLLGTALFSTGDILPGTLHNVQGSDVEQLSSNEPELRELLLSERYGLRTDFLSRYGDEVRRLLDRVSYIGPYRRPPERIEVLRDRDAQSVGRAGEDFHYMLRAYDRRSLKLNRWLKKLHVPYTLELMQADVKERSAVVGSVVQVRYHDNRFDTDVSATDIGFGVGQVIPIIVEGILSKNKIIAVEQPELHLHPKLQADFADLLVETLHSEHQPEGNQWIIETHSELILLRILRRIKEGTLSSRAVKVLYIDPPPPSEPGDLGSQIFDLELSDDGRFLVPWPNGFFAEQSNEVFGGAPL